jgi:hypothetical protein
MGTLRLKRGTKTALQTTPGYIPAEGELVYTTDSKEVFVGDGNTTGGIPVSVSTQNLEDLGNVQALAAQKDQILVYNGSNWAATDNPQLDLRGNIYADDSTLLVDAINGQIVGPVNTSSIISSGNIVGDLVGDVTGSVTGSVVGDTTGTHYGDVVGSVTGDLVGSVFADDSTQLLDAITGTVNGRIVSETTITVRNPVVGGTTGDAMMDLHGFGWDGTQQTLGGQIKIAVDLDETVSNGIVPGRILLIPQSTSGSVTAAQVLTWNSKGRLGLGINRPDTVLHVVGDAKITTDLAVEGTATIEELDVGSYMMAARNTTAERDALTAMNGMMIYNTDTNKFQGYENGSWVNLV